MDKKNAEEKTFNFTTSKLFVKASHYIEGETDTKDLICIIQGDILFNVEKHTKIDGVCHIEPLRESFLKEYGVAELKDKIFSLALKNTAEQSDMVFYETDDFELEIATQNYLRVSASMKLPMDKKSIMFYGNRNLFNAASVLFLSPYGLTAEDVAKKFDSDLYIIPISQGYCLVLSTENTLITIDEMYEMLEESNKRNENMLSDKIWSYSREYGEIMEVVK